MIKGIRHAAPCTRLTRAGKEQTQQRSDINCGANCRPGCCAYNALIHYNGRRKISDLIHFRTVIVRHFVAQKQRIALLPLPLGFHGYGIKSQRAFP